MQLPYASFSSGSKTYHDSYYSDNYFKGKASTYNSRLAVASLAVAMASYQINDTDNYSHTKELYNKIGFEKFYKNEFADQNSQKDALGVVMASKKMDGYTLLSVGARGAGYGYEWASNFEVGNDGKFASGFNVASEVVLKTINDYIDDNNITGNVKIWATGYSRAGAAVNLAFGKIDDALSKNNNLLPKVNYTKDDLFVYTFEAPAGRVGTIEDNIFLEKTENYNNIMNLINLDDIVPMVMPKDWVFVRYGVDYYIPSRMTDYNYDAYLGALKFVIKNMYSEETFGEYKLDTFTLESSDYINYTFGKYIEMLVGDLFEEIGGLEGYVYGYEETISEIIGLALGDVAFRTALNEFVDRAKLKILAPAVARLSEPDIDKAVDDIFSAVETEYNAMLEKEAFAKIDTDEFTLCAKKLMKLLINVIKKEGGLTAIGKLVQWMPSIIYPHIPEIEYANILAMEMGTTKYPPQSSYYKAVISANTEFTIKIKGTVVAEYKNGTLTTKLVCELVDGDYIIYFPKAGGFEIDASSYNVYEIGGSYFEPQLLIGGTVA